MIKRYKQNETDTLAKILKNDGVISVPTDTVYGVCARINSKKAHDNLVKTKNRPITKPFPVMCSDEEQIKSIAIRPEAPEYVNNGKTTIAIRMATSKVVKELIIKTGCPIFMSSANQSGEPTCTNLDEIENECPNLDGMMEGTVKFGKGSTIVDCVSKELKILREGPITIEQIREVLEE